MLFSSSLSRSQLLSLRFVGIESFRRCVTCVFFEFGTRACDHKRSASERLAHSRHSASDSPPGPFAKWGDELWLVVVGASGCFAAGKRSNCALERWILALCSIAAFASSSEPVPAARSYSSARWWRCIASCCHEQVRKNNTEPFCISICLLMCSFVCVLS